METSQSHFPGSQVWFFFFFPVGNLIQHRFFKIFIFPDFQILAPRIPFHPIPREYQLLINEIKNGNLIGNCLDFMDLAQRVWILGSSSCSNPIKPKFAQIFAFLGCCSPKNARISWKIGKTGLGMKFFAGRGRGKTPNSGKILGKEGGNYLGIQALPGSGIYGIYPRFLLAEAGMNSWLFHIP